MARRILAWECRYCGTVKKSETICDRHEITCMKNPNARNCIVCQNSYQRVVDIYNGEEEKEPLSCRYGKVCSRATSAKCEHFERKVN